MLEAKREVLAMLPQLRLGPGDALPDGTSNWQINQAEERLGLRFPPELVDWLQVCNGPLVGQGGVYGLRPNSAFVDIESRHARLPDWCRNEYLPIAGDGCGSDYVISAKATERGLFPVYFLDHADRNVLDRPSYLVASGLWQFLWFYFRNDLGERGWPCNEKFVLEHDQALALIDPAKFCWEG